MAKCMVCGKIALLPTNIGNIVLCKSCASVVNASTWKDRNFVSMDDLEQKKNNAIQMAVSNGFSQNAVFELSRFFDEYINAGFVTTINGMAGQTLKVFLGHCIVHTKSESAKTSLSNDFHQFDDSKDASESLFTADDAQNLVRELRHGRLIEAGIDAAFSASAKQQDAERREQEKKKMADRLVTLEDRVINLANVWDVEVFYKSNIVNGYLKFVPKGIKSNDLYKCDYFFFNNSIPFESKKIKKQIESICCFIRERIQLIENEEKNRKIAEQAEKQRANQEVLQRTIKEGIYQGFQQNSKPQSSDVFEEVRKFKELLDEGIISQEEFEKKKKELLGL